MPVTPEHFFQAVQGYQETAALKGALQLDLFTHIDEGISTAPELARCLEASPRGVRILCDYLVVKGFLTKSQEEYHLTAESAAFLSRRSQRYLGGTLDFLLAPQIMSGFADVAALVRRGTTLLERGGSLDPGFPAWVRFARAMAPLAAATAREVANLLETEEISPRNILDIAAGHGLYGITLAARHRQARVTALDWPAVLEVARENARQAGLEDRYRTLQGSALEVDWPGRCDLILLTNFLHHFDIETCGQLLRKARGALARGGLTVTLEFVPDESRVSPARAATFSLQMLASTPAGDAYTFSQYEQMFRQAGFARSRLHSLPQSDQRVILSTLQ